MKIDLMNKYHYTSLSVPKNKDKSEGGLSNKIDKQHELGYYSGNFRGNGVTTTGFWKFMQKANSFCFDKETGKHDCVINKKVNRIKRSRDNLPRKPYRVEFKRERMVKNKIRNKRQRV